MALILTFSTVSGAHFNPLVTLVEASRGGIAWRDVPIYQLAQILGALCGVAAANLMFDLPVYSASQHIREGAGQLLSEGIATFGLLAVIWGCSRHRVSRVPMAVGAYFTAGYWFTSSTAMANPAVRIARSLTDTFSGIRPVDVPAFILVQILGAAAATALFRWLVPGLPSCDHAVIAPDGSTNNPATPQGPSFEDTTPVCLHSQQRPQPDG